MTEQEIGVVKHYFDRVGVAAIEITDGTLSAGDTVHIKGHTTDVTVTVGTMQIEHATVQTAKKGDAVGIKIDGKAREHDKVFKVIP
jgi:putative protease